MFINESVFKRLIKKAYGAGRLHIYVNKLGWVYIGGGYWNIQIPRKSMTNKMLASLIEIIGELPKHEEAFTYSKEETQELMPSYFSDIFEAYDEYTDAFSPTRLLMHTSRADLAIWQRMSGDPVKVLLPSYANDIIDTTHIEGGENYPEAPKGQRDRAHCLIWRNNDMALQIICIHTEYKGESDLMTKLNESNLAWTETSDDSIG